MATNNTPTTLGNLEFSEIKKSLSDFLKNQSVFSGYNFEGSAIQTLIDLLVYNTFYYAYYANMINAEAFLDSAQKEDSVISLTKPLGYTVPSRTAAKAKVIVSGVSADIPLGTVFTSTNENGIQFNFYVIDQDEPVVDGSTSEFYIYEGTQYINRLDYLPNFDYEKQRIPIADTDFDLDTLKVYITEKIDDQTFVTNEWTKVQNVGYVSQADENIYFVERTSTGFIIQFSVGNEIGRVIDDTITKIEVSYLKTSGSAGNGLINFRNTTLGGNVVVTLTDGQSVGGRDKPDLDSVRNLAPKWFASQERAVTVNDYKALLLEAGFFDNEFQFNVFGGQDLVPPRYGRVFISSDLDSTSQRVQEITNFIKDRSVITILPEYVVPTAMNIYTDFDFRMGTPNTQTDRTYVMSAIKSIFRTKYAVFSEYNAEFSASEFVDDLLTNTDYDVRVRNITISPDNFTIYLKENIVPNIEYTFNTQNEFDLPVNTYVDITNNFNLPANIIAVNNLPTGTLGVLRFFVSFTSQKFENINLQLWAVKPDGTESQISGNFGYFNAYKGLVNIKNNVLGGSAELTINFLKKSFKIGLNNLVTFNYNNIQIF